MLGSSNTNARDNSHGEYSRNPQVYPCNSELGDPVSQTRHGGDFGTGSEQCDFYGVQELD
jgi:hypothetical protein